MKNLLTAVIVIVVIIAGLAIVIMRYGGLGNYLSAWADVLTLFVILIVGFFIYNALTKNNKEE